MAQSVIGALRVNLGLDSAQFMKGAKKAQSTAQRMAANFAKVGAAVSVVGTGIAVAVRGQLGAFDDLAKTSQRIGVPVEALSQMRHAAELSGASLEGMQRGLRNVSRTMVNSADRFTDLGIAVRDADGNMRPVIEVFEDAAQVISQMEDGADKTALAMQLFGERAGPELIPMLNQGRDGIREMREEADRLGLTVSTESAQAAERFNDNLTRLGGQMQGVVRIVTAELAPILEKISDVVVSVAEKFQGMSDPMRRFVAIAAGLTVVLGPVLIAVGGLVAVLGLVSAPVLAIVAGVAALTAGLVAFWPEIKAAAAALRDMVENGLRQLEVAGQSMVEGINNLVRAFQSWARDGIDYVKGKLQELVDFAMGLGRRMYEAGANIVTGLKDGITEGVANAWSGITGAFDKVLSYLPGQAEINSPSRLFQRFGGWLMAGLGLGIQQGAQGPVSAMQEVAGTLDGPIQSAMSSLESTAQNAFTGFVTGAMSAKEAIGQLLQSLAKTWADSAFQSLFGGAFGDGGFLSFLNPFGGGKAMGGPVNAGTTYLVGEKGPELFTPGAGGVITPNHKLDAAQGGGQMVIRLDLSPDVEARIMEQSGNQAVQIVQTYDRDALPRRMQQISRDPRRIG